MHARPPGASSRSHVAKNGVHSFSPTASSISMDATFVNVPSSSRKSRSTTSIRLREAGVRGALPGELRLRRRDRHRGDACSELARRGQRERAPAAADLEDVVVRAELESLAHPAQLAPLSVRERLVVVLEDRARVGHGLVQEEREEVVAEVVVGLDVPARREQSRAAVEPRPRLREATPPGMALGARAGVAQEQLEQRHEIVRVPLARLERLAERELGASRDAVEQVPVVDPHERLRPRPVAPLGAVGQPQDERSAMDPGQHALEHRHRDAPDGGRPALPTRGRSRSTVVNCRTDPFPGSNGGLWWNGTRLSQSFAAFQWMSAVTCAGMSG